MLNGCGEHKEGLNRGMHSQAGAWERAMFKKVTFIMQQIKIFSLIFVNSLLQYAVFYTVKNKK